MSMLTRPTLVMTMTILSYCETYDLVFEKSETNEVEERSRKSKGHICVGSVLREVYNDKRTRTRI